MAELIKLIYKTVVPNEADPVRHRLQELQRQKIFKATYAVLRTYFVVVPRLENPEALFLNQTENNAFMGVYIRGLDNSIRNGLSSNIEQIRDQTGILCHQFEEHFAETFTAIKSDIFISFLFGTCNVVVFGKIASLGRIFEGAAEGLMP